MFKLLLKFFKNKHIKSKNAYIYDTPEKWENISDITSRNYSNIEKRLSHRNKFSNYILIYYSVFLIINTLSPKYIPYNKELSEYTGIILSIIMLAYSLVNNSANYPIRINNIVKSINDLKTIKRRIKIETIDDFKRDYFNITDNTELRTDIDFFRTVSQLCKEAGTSIRKIDKTSDFYSKDKLLNYIAELGNIYIIQIKIRLLFILDTFTILMPIFAIATCIIFKDYKIKI